MADQNSTRTKVNTGSGNAKAVQVKRKTPTANRKQSSPGRTETKAISRARMEELLEKEKQNKNSKNPVNGTTTIMSRNEMDALLAESKDKHPEKQVKAGNTVIMSRSEVNSRLGKVDSQGRRKKTGGATGRSKDPQWDKVNDSYNPYKRTGLQITRKLTFCIVIFLVFAALCIAAYTFGYKVFNDKAVDSSDLAKYEITLTGNETDDEVGKMLLDLGVINDLTLYKLRCKIYDSDYQAGTFKVSKSYNTEKILNILAGYDYSDGTLEE